MDGCVFCDRKALPAEAEVYVENDWFVYASLFGSP